MRLPLALLVLLTLALPRARAAHEDTSLRLPQWPAQVPTPELHLTDTAGHARSLTDYKGHIAIVYFGFVSCPDVCPATLRKLALAGHKLGRAADRIELVFVTLDPEHDTAAQLDAYVKMAGLRATALTGSPQSIDRAAQQFSVQYARVVSKGAASIDHSGGLFIIDASGRLRLVAPVSVAVDDLAHDLRLLALEAQS